MGVILAGPECGLPGPSSCDMFAYWRGLLNGARERANDTDRAQFATWVARAKELKTQSVR